MISESAHSLALSSEEEAAEYLRQKLRAELRDITLEESIPLIRYCSHYLNLTGIAETHHRVRAARQTSRPSKGFEEVFEALLHKGVDQDTLYEHVCSQNVEVVLTAHPTQVNRRTLQYKHTRIQSCLDRHDLPDLTSDER